MKKGISISVLVTGIMTVLCRAASIVLGAIGLAFSQKSRY